MEQHTKQLQSQGYSTGRPWSYSKNKMKLEIAV